MIVVTGNARSGTSMVMHVLIAGGLSGLVDGWHRPGADHAFPPENVHGFFEHSGALQAPVETLGPRAADRFCVKLFADGLAEILAAGVVPDRVLVASRPGSESVASFKAAGEAARARGVEKFTPFGEPDDEVAAIFDELTAELLLTLPRLGVPTLEVGFHDLIDNPVPTVAAIAEFVGGGLDTAAMERVPDPALRHHGRVCCEQDCSRCLRRPTSTRETEIEMTKHNPGWSNPKAPAVSTGKEPKRPVSAPATPAPAPAPHPANPQPIKP